MALKDSRKLGTGVWVWYLAAGAVLALTRVALFVWLVYQQSYRHIYTETNAFIVDWLYPEVVVSTVWRSLAVFYGTKYFLAWGSIFTVGSFVMATPILIVGWLRNRHMMSRPSR